MASNTSVYDMLVGEDPSIYQRDYDPVSIVDPNLIVHSFNVDFKPKPGVKMRKVAVQSTRFCAMARSF